MWTARVHPLKDHDEPQSVPQPHQMKRRTGGGLGYQNTVARASDGTGAFTLSNTGQPQVWAPKGTLKAILCRGLFLPLAAPLEGDPKHHEDIPGRLSGNAPF